MRAVLRFALPPLGPVAILVGFACVVGWRIEHSPIEYLPNGRIDNGPELAAGAVILLSPIVYAVLFALHALALYMARLLLLGPLLLWLIVILVSTCALVAWSMHHQPLEESLLQRAVFAFVFSIVLFVPLGVSSVLLTRTLKQKKI